MMLQHDIAIIGAGPTGLAAALAFAKQGSKVALVAPRARHFDSGRTAALMAPALDLLATLVPLDRLEAIGAVLHGIRIIDVTGALFRAPTITFRASEIGLDRFGLNLPNDKLVDLLEDSAAGAHGITRFDDALAGYSDEGGRVELTLASGAALSSAAVIGADGKASHLRKLAGISARSWEYKQSALTFHVRHERDHMDVSTEFHTREGPFTLVPLGEGLSSVVWMMAPDKAEELKITVPDLFERMASQMCHAMLGKLTLASERALIPMGGLSAETLAKGRAALVGEAAHAFPPIGAQGLNLGLRDVRDLLAATSGTSDMVPALARYAALRQSDVMLRTVAVDAMNRSLLAGFLPLDLLRGLGMTVIGAISPLRRAVMRAGIGDMGGLLPAWPRRPGKDQGKRSAGK